MKNWSLKDIPEDQRKNHIINCLIGYIQEVNDLQQDGVLPPFISEDVVSVAELYQAIIGYLKE